MRHRQRSRLRAIIVRQQRLTDHVGIAAYPVKPRTIHLHGVELSLPLSLLLFGPVTLYLPFDHRLQRPVVDALRELALPLHPCSQLPIHLLHQPPEHLAPPLAIQRVAKRLLRPRSLDASEIAVLRERIIALAIRVATIEDSRVEHRPGQILPQAYQHTADRLPVALLEDRRRLPDNAPPDRCHQLLVPLVES